MAWACVCLPLLESEGLEEAVDDVDLLEEGVRKLCVDDAAEDNGVMDEPIVEIEGNVTLC